MSGNISIALSGKARSGKDTVAKMFANLLSESKPRIEALANPMKQIIEIMFPGSSKECLYGASELRASVISNNYTDKHGKPLTYRQALLDMGAFARRYNEDIWLHCLLEGVKKDTNATIVSDIRRKNEFNFFKKHNFTMIRVVRDTYTRIDDLSETEQDLITNDEFSFIIDNNSTLETLFSQVKDIVRHIQDKQ